MNNSEVYRKTLSFSLRRILWDLLAFLVLVATAGLGFLIAERSMDKGLIGLAIGGVVGLVLLAIILRYVSYSLKAGQIAMMTKGVTEGTLPDDVVGEGKQIVKRRFKTVALYYAATGAIKAIFNELSKAISALGKSVGGDTGSAVGDAIGTVVSVVVGYLCDCCLGWVFYREGIGAAKATCEGAVLFFKHGKTLAKNMGRVFGIGLGSLVAVGGVFSGIFYLIFSRFPQAFEQLRLEIVDAAARNSLENLPSWLTSSATTLMIAAAVIAGLIIWAMIHSTFIRPFVLVGVLRNYMASGINDIPTEDSFTVLDSKSSKFKKLHQEAA